ncbi:MAG: MFS transporter [Fimbriimonadales bacterium]|nr:MFS transporter [Fimbriimonadales bacterium]
MQTEVNTRQGAGRLAWLALGWIALVAFLDTFALVPILAPYAQRALGASEAQAGLILSLYSLANLLANFYSGALIDRFGRRLPMALSLWAAGLLIALYPLAQNAETLMALRALHGATGAVFVPALFALVGEYGRANRTGAMGGAGALIGLVALLAPPLGGIAAKHYGEPALFWGVAGLMLLGGAAALLLHEPPRDAPTRPRETPLKVLSLPALRAAYLLTLGMTTLMGVLTFALPVSLQAAGYDAAYRGRLFGLLALVSILVMASLRRSGLLGGAYGRAQVGLGFFAAGALALNALPTPTGAWLAVGLFGIGFGLTFPAVHLAAFENAPDAMRGASLAILHAFYSLGYVAGPAMAGIVGAGAAGYVGAIAGIAIAFVARQQRRIN